MNADPYTYDKTGSKPVSENSENVLENSKYVKTLELQRSILKKLIESDLIQASLNTEAIPENPDTNNPITKP